MFSKSNPKSFSYRGEIFDSFYKINDLIEKFPDKWKSILEELGIEDLTDFVNDRVDLKYYIKAFPGRLEETLNKVGLAKLHKIIKDIWDIKYLLNDFSADEREKILYKLWRRLIIRIKSNEVRELLLLLPENRREAYLDNLGYDFLKSMPIDKGLLIETLPVDEREIFLGQLEIANKCLTLVPQKQLAIKLKNNPLEVKEDNCDFFAAVKNKNFRFLFKLLADEQICLTIDLEACDDSNPPENVFDVVLKNPRENLTIIKILVFICKIQQDAKKSVDPGIPGQILKAFLMDFQKQYKDVKMEAVSKALELLEETEGFYKACFILKRVLMTVAEVRDKQLHLDHLFQIEELMCGLYPVQEKFDALHKKEAKSDKKPLRPTTLKVMTTLGSEYKDSPATNPGHQAEVPQPATEVDWGAGEWDESANEESWDITVTSESTHNATQLNRTV